MQCLAIDLVETLRQQFVSFAPLLPTYETSPAVGRIAQYRATQMLSMNTNLVSPSGFQPKLHKRGVAKDLYHAIRRNCPFSFVIREDLHAFSIPGIPAEMGFNSTFIGIRHAKQECAIRPHHGSFGQLLRKPGMRLVRFRDYQNSRGVFVQPVHKPWPYGGISFES